MKRRLEVFSEPDARESEIEEGKAGLMPRLPLYGSVRRGTTRIADGGLDADHCPPMTGKVTEVPTAMSTTFAWLLIDPEAWLTMATPLKSLSEPPLIVSVRI